MVLEKLNFPGGNTLISQGFINAADPVRQPKQGIKDSWQHHAEQTLEAGDFRGQKDRVDVLCRNAYPTIEWLESLGMQFKPKVIQILVRSIRVRTFRRCLRDKATGRYFPRPQRSSA